MSRYPDGARSRVVLIGTSDYERHPSLQNLPAVRNNLSGLHRAFVEAPGAVFDHLGCTVVDSPDSPRSLLVRLRRAAETAEDVLLVYYAGHGVLDRNGDLHLTVRETDPDPYGIDGTAVPFATVKKIIEDSPAQVRVLVLDCCFSGRAVGAMSAQSAAAEQVEVAGTYILTSSQADRVSLAVPGERYTAFTGEVVRLLTEGDGSLTLHELDRQLRVALAKKGLPRPMARADDTSQDLLVKKPFAAPAPAEPVPVTAAAPPKPADAVPVAFVPPVAPPAATASEVHQPAAAPAEPVRAKVIGAAWEGLLWAAGVFGLLMVATGLSELATNPEPKGGVALSVVMVILFAALSAGCGYGIVRRRRGRHWEVVPPGTPKGPGDGSLPGPGS
ncbi:MULTISPECIES: caspase family protein [Amycolatopsis]|uniref:Peptide/nickel transport system substrate-binding protein n=2 Tax=Amycolatopsis TaxID=1813 RepID=A0A1I4CTU6_9PSEU|nr:caspase family protein [Amycolatopsis sacchari]SFK84325.1 peptide/nickel transport system substrate-binding protein [Amycolatopsis sacchari]